MLVNMLKYYLQIYYNFPAENAWKRKKKEREKQQQKEQKPDIGK